LKKVGAQRRTLLDYCGAPTDGAHSRPPRLLRMLPELASRGALRAVAPQHAKQPFSDHLTR